MAAIALGTRLPHRQQKPAASAAPVRAMGSGGGGGGGGQRSRRVGNQKRPGSGTASDADADAALVSHQERPGSGGGGSGGGTSTVGKAAGRAAAAAAAAPAAAATVEPSKAAKLPDQRGGHTGQPGEEGKEEEEEGHAGGNSAGCPDARVPVGLKVPVYPLTADDTLFMASGEIMRLAHRLLTLHAPAWLRHVFVERYGDALDFGTCRWVRGHARA